MKLMLVILAFPAIFVFLLTIAMVRSARDRYQRRQIERGAVLSQLATAATLWGSLVLLGGAMMNGMGLGAKSPLAIIGVALVIGGAVFVRLTKGILWGKA